MESRRTAVLGAVVGLLLLLLVLAFAVGLPKVEGAPDDDLSGVLPDSLPAVDGVPTLTAIDTGTGEQAAAAETFVKQQDSVAANLEKAYDAPVAVRAYSTEDQQTSATVVVVGDAAAFSVPDQLPVDPELIGLDQAPSETTRDGDVTCTSYFDATGSAAAPAPGSEAPDPSTPVGVSCQLATTERTYVAQVSGLGADQTADLLRALAEEA